MMRMTKNKDDVETSLDEQRSSPKAGAPANGGGISRSGDGSGLFKQIIFNDEKSKHTC